MEEEKKLHRDCDPHDAGHCDINTQGNLEPGLDDCGHRVEGPGPGTYGVHAPGGPGHENCDHE